MNSKIKIAFDRFIEFIDRHEVIWSILFIPIIGYMAVALDETFSPDEISREKNPLIWAQRWFGLIILGTVTEVIILSIIGIAFMLIMSIFVFGYIYILPLFILFISLWGGRVLYWKKRDKEKKLKNDQKNLSTIYELG